MQQIEAIPDTDKFLPARLVRRRYGDISAMSLHRWLADDDLGFPRPVYLGRLRFWKLRDLLEWESRRPRTKAEAACVPVNIEAGPRGARNRLRKCQRCGGD
jgi:predicted DNA-binding transcriptional regulator AlpA